jgi:hypothetical protein
MNRGTARTAAWRRYGPRRLAVTVEPHSPGRQDVLARLAGNLRFAHAGLRIINEYDVPTPDDGYFAGLRKR